MIHIDIQLNGFHHQGAQEVFQGLPVEYVDVDHLPKVAKHGGSLD